MHKLANGCSHRDGSIETRAEIDHVLHVPELPEVETTRRGIEPHVVGRASRLRVHDHRLRWPVDLAMVAAVAGSAIRRAGRRAKYLLIETEAGTLILHLGMSGSLRVLPRIRRASRTITSTSSSTPARRCASTIRAASAACMFTHGDPTVHPLLKGLAPEPLEPEFDAEYLSQNHAPAQGRHQAAHHEFAPRGRRRQHLRERGVVPRAHTAAAPGAFAEPRRMRASSRAPSRQRWRWR